MLGCLHTAKGSGDMEGDAGQLERAEHEIVRRGSQETKPDARNGDTRYVAD